MQQRQRNGKHALSDDTDNATNVSSVKRIRGGGMDDDEDLYDQDEFQDEIEEPEDSDHDNDESNENNDNVPSDTADTAVSFSDLTPAQLKRWARPPVPDAAQDASTADLHLQWLDMDMVSGQPLASNPNRRKKHIVGAQEGEVPVIRVYGVTDHGNSIVTFIHGYTPYGYFALPEGHELKYKDEREKSHILGKIRDLLNDRLKTAKSNRSKSNASDRSRSGSALH